MAVKWNNVLVNKIRSAASDGVSDAVDSIYEETLRLVQDTQKSGRIYKKKNGRQHQASAPGESYANDTGNALLNTNKKHNKLSGEVVGDYEYALALELGTQKMAPRPTLGRALQNLVPSLTDIVSKPIKDVIAND